MRITKEVAENTAVKMTAKKSLELKQFKSDFSDKIRALKVKEIPKNVMEAYEYFPNYFNTSTYVYLKGVGFNNDCVSIQRIPYNNNSYVELSGKLATELLKEFNKIKSLEKEIKDLNFEIYSVLYSTLKTYKRVEESFPEALQYLPQSNNNKTALVVNLSSLREKIK